MLSHTLPFPLVCMSGGYGQIARFALIIPPFASTMSHVLRWHLWACEHCTRVTGASPKGECPRHDGEPRCMARTRQQKLPYLLGICLIAVCALQTSAYDLNLPAGYSFIGNNLSRPPNDLNTILGPSAGIIPAGSEVFKWQNGSNYTAPYLYSIYDGTTWSSNLSFAPGEAVFLRVSSPVSLTFTGVAATLNLPVNTGSFNPLKDGRFFAYSDQHPPGGTSVWSTI